MAELVLIGSESLQKNGRSLPLPRIRVNADTVFSSTSGEDVDDAKRSEAQAVAEAVEREVLLQLDRFE